MCTPWSGDYLNKQDRGWEKGSTIVLIFQTAHGETGKFNDLPSLCKKSLAEFGRQRFMLCLSSRKMADI